MLCDAHRAGARDLVCVLPYFRFHAFPLSLSSGRASERSQSRLRIRFMVVTRHAIVFRVSLCIAHQRYPALPAETSSFLWKLGHGLPRSSHIPDVSVDPPLPARHTDEPDRCCSSSAGRRKEERKIIRTRAHTRVYTYTYIFFRGISFGRTGYTARRSVHYVPKRSARARTGLETRARPRGGIEFFVR